MSLVKILNKKIVICCGSGGVGKTTTAAAIALEAACRGKKAIVLTIDPAKRLAAALGLSALENDPVEVSLDSLEIENKSSGRLYAMMLDTKRTFDRLIERHTPDPARRTAIFQNHLYQHMSNMIAGSQEYMAMERLHELFHENQFDFLVLDTPPTRHALDFLEAPRRMINITSNSLLVWFLKPGLFAGRVGLGVFQKGAEKIFSVFDRLAGFSFLHELAEMLSLLANMLGGFQERAEEVYQLLRRDEVGFLLVSSPAFVAIQDALYFHNKISESNLPFLGFVVNRIHEKSVWSEKDLPNLSTTLQSKIISQLKNYDQLSLRDQRSINLLRKMGGRGIVCKTIPLLGQDVHDLRGLVAMRKSLF